MCNFHNLYECKDLLLQVFICLKILKVFILDSFIFFLHIFIFEMRPTFTFSLAIFVCHFNFNHGHSFFSIICIFLSVCLSSQQQILTIRFICWEKKQTFCQQQIVKYIFVYCFNKTEIDSFVDLIWQNYRIHWLQNGFCHDCSYTICGLIFCTISKQLHKYRTIWE